MKIHILEVKET